MTREEFTTNIPITPISKNEASVQTPDGMRFRFDVPSGTEDIVGYARMRVVLQAISEGKPVPDYVLADYPDLAE